MLSYKAVTSGLGTKRCLACQNNALTSCFGWYTCFGFFPIYAFSACVRSLYPKYFLQHVFLLFSGVTVKRIILPYVVQICSKDLKIWCLEHHETLVFKDTLKIRVILHTFIDFPKYIQILFSLWKLSPVCIYSKSCHLFDGSVQFGQFFRKTFLSLARGVGEQMSTLIISDSAHIDH